MLSTRNDKLPRTGPFPAALASLFAASLIVIAGCGEDHKDRVPPRAAIDADFQAPSLVVSSDPAVRPVIYSDVTAVDAWLDLVRRLTVGETVTLDSYQVLLETPAYRMIDDDRKRNNLNRRIMKRAMEQVFAGRDSLDTPAPKRPDLLGNFTYLKDRLAETAAPNRDFCTPTLLNDLRGALTDVVPPEDLPAEITIRFFAGAPLIGFTEPDKFAMDIGLALAAGPRQAAQLLAGRLYIALAPVDGVKPDFSQAGEVKLAGAFRMLRHSAVASWLGGKASVRFDDAHPQLRGQALHAPEIQADARLILGRMAMMMRNMFDPVVASNQAKYGGKIDNLLRFNDRYEKIGWAMAKLIADRFGKDRLLSVAGDTAAFMRAYQEAALASAASGEPLGLPPFPAGMFEDLMAHLSTY
ncbi:hypothetical protein KKA85_03985 [bacterium]|nr:hypothetical protein [bacterium]MBU1674921.1 hypothetical protein [bacterium]